MPGASAGQELVGTVSSYFLGSASFIATSFFSFLSFEDEAAALPSASFSFFFAAFLPSAA
jgi:hypothetical protein